MIYRISFALFAFLILLLSTALVHQKTLVLHGISRIAWSDRCGPFRSAVIGNSGNEDLLVRPIGLRIADEGDAKDVLHVAAVLLREQILSLLRVGTVCICCLFLFWQWEEHRKKTTRRLPPWQVAVIAGIIGFSGGRSESLLLSSFDLPTTAELRSRVIVHDSSP